MPKAVEGFQIADGRFFHNREEADFEEAKLILVDSARSAVQVTQNNLPAFLDFLEKYTEQVLDYCHAYKALYPVKEAPNALQGGSTSGPDQEPSTPQREDEETFDRSRS